MMNLIFRILLVGITLFSISCSSNKKISDNYHKGNYDFTFNELVDKYIEKRGDLKPELIDMMYSSYTKANEHDQDRISEILIYDKSNEKYPSLIAIYKSLRKRQERLLPLSPLTLSTDIVHIRKIDYLPQIQEASYAYSDELINRASTKLTGTQSIEISQAIDLLNLSKTYRLDHPLLADKLSLAKKLYKEMSWQESLQLLRTGSKDDAQKAYHKFKELKNDYPDLTEASEMMHKAQELGTYYIGVYLDLPRNMRLSKQTENKLYDINLSKLNNDWTIAEWSQPKTKYDIEVEIVINELKFGRNDLNENKIVYNKEIEDGSIDVIVNGKQILDSMGNKVTVPKYVQLTGTVIESIQHKKSELHGQLMVYDKINGTHKKHSLDHLHEFSNEFHTISGDQRAVDKSKHKIGGNPIPFPTDDDMFLAIWKATDEKIIKELKKYRNKL